MSTRPGAELVSRPSRRRDDCRFTSSITEPDDLLAVLAATTACGLTPKCVGVWGICGKHPSSQRHSASTLAQRRTCLPHAPRSLDAETDCPSPVSARTGKAAYSIRRIGRLGGDEGSAIDGAAATLIARRELVADRH